MVGMAALEATLVWDDILDLAGTLSGVARVRRRFLSYGQPAEVQGASDPRLHDGNLPERATALARAGLYNFLAASFGEPPTDEYVGSLLESGAIALLVSKGIGGEDLRAWGHAVHLGQLAHELSGAYLEAFLRPGERRAPLLASNDFVAALALDTPAAMTLSHGPAAEAVEAAYREAGLVVGGDGPIAPQHLAVKLQFMHHLAAREAAAWGEGNPELARDWRIRQSKFLSDHLQHGVAGLSEELSRAGAHPYYRALADLTMLFLSADSLELAKPGLVRTG